MLKRIFPERLDNTFRGHPAAVWLMAFFAIANLVIGAVAIFSPDSGAQSADGVPLFSFTVGGASTIIGVVALLGLAGVVMGALYAIVVVRYRAMIPLMYLFIVFDYVARRGLAAFKPIAHEAGHVGGSVVLTMTALSVIGLVLSLIGKRYREATPLTS